MLEAKLDPYVDICFSCLERGVKTVRIYDFPARGNYTLPICKKCVQIVMDAFKKKVTDG